MKEIEIKAKNYDQAIEQAVKETGKSVDELDFVCIKEPGLFRKGIYKVSYEDEPKVEKPKVNTNNKPNNKPNTNKPNNQNNNKPNNQNNQNNNKPNNKPNTKPAVQEQKPVVKENAPKQPVKEDKPKTDVINKKENDTIKVSQTTKIVSEDAVQPKTEDVSVEEQTSENKVSNAELDHFIRNFLVDFARAQGVEVEVESTIRDGIKVYVINGSEAHKLIGYHGENLNAMQIIAGATVTEKYKITTRVVVDIEQYKAKREESLKALARKTARRVIQTRRSQKLEPMNANERRIIHSELQSNQKVTTESHGTEPHRFVVIKLK